MQTTKNKHWFQAARHAGDGIQYAIRHERNVRFDLVIGTLVILASWWCHLTRWEWVVVLLLIGLVISAEIMNSALEAVVDLTTKQHYHPLAKAAKDMAAGMVWLLAIVAAISGLIIFIPHLVAKF